MKQLYKFILNTVISLFILLSACAPTTLQVAPTQTNTVIPIVAQATSTMEPTTISVLNTASISTVTAVEIIETSIHGNGDDVKWFVANRPFVYAITEKSTGAIIFIGIMKDPTQTKVELN